MSSDSPLVDPELAAMTTVLQALAPLEEDARTRVLEWIVNRLGVKVPGALKGHPQHAPSTAAPSDAETVQVGDGSSTAKYATFAELHDAANPSTNPERALVAAYWVQVIEGAEDFEGQPINTNLKHLGHGIKNITEALTALKDQKPALVIQLQKAGKTRQARKTYKVTNAGIKAVEGMLGG